MERSLNRFSLDKLHQEFVKAIESVYREQWYLFEHHLSEWTVSFQLYYYLRHRLCKALGSYSIDGEYNHMSGGDIDFLKKCIGDGQVVRPDIIIHRRGNPHWEDVEANYLWVELKLHGGKPFAADCKKLMVVTGGRVQGAPRVSGYRYGLGVLMTKTKIECKWYESGMLKRSYFAKVKKSGKMIVWQVVN